MVYSSRQNKCNSRHFFNKVDNDCYNSKCVLEKKGEKNEK